MKLCEVCGAPEHPEWKAHVFVNKEEVVNKGSVNKGVVNKVVNKDRNAYMREYMRVWREKRKAKG